MNKKNYLQDLLFIDKKLEEYTFSDMQSGLSVADQKKLMEQKLQDIKKQLEDKAPDFFVEYKDKTFVESKINPSDLFIDKTHNNLDNKQNVGGTKLIDFLRQYRYYLDVRYRLNFVINHFEFFSQNLPVIVQKIEDKYYIKFGNHRAMAALEKGLQKIKVILLK